eukprot:14050760-Ditylum_brightwellii.AAC.2
MDFLDEHGYITVDQENKKDVNAALRSVQCYLCHLGYRQGKKKGTHHYKLQEENLQKRDEYVQFMKAINQQSLMKTKYFHMSHKKRRQNLQKLI